MNRWLVRLFVFVAGAVIPLCCFGQQLTRPNIVVILVDDWGVMDSSVAFLCDEQGTPKKYPLNDQYRTPNLERLAKYGTRFSTFYAMSVCSPTRVSLLTGQTSARHRTTNWIDPERNNAAEFGPPDWQWSGLTSERVTLPTVLRDAGYRTIHCGKGHFGPFDSDGSDPTKLGFDVNIGGSGAGQPGSYFGAQNFGNGPGPRARWGVPSLLAYHGQEIFLTEALTLEFNKAISSAVSEGRPFFAYFAHYAVHAPFQADPRFIEHYRDQPKDLAAFSALVEGVDRSIGDVIAHLKELGVAENTLVLVLGDNGTDAPRGDPFGIRCAAPLRGKKGTPYEGGMRVPFVASWAEPAANEIQKRFPIAASSVQRQLAAVYDLLPTILAVANVSANGLTQPLDGISLWPVLEGNQQPASVRDFLMHYPHEHRSSYFTVFRRDHWKLIYHYRQPAAERFELFDLAADPGESSNLAATQPDQLEQMFLAMRESLESSHAQYPLADDHRTPLLPAHQ